MPKKITGVHGKKPGPKKQLKKIMRQNKKNLAALSTFKENLDKQLMGVATDIAKQVEKQSSIQSNLAKAALKVAKKTAKNELINLSKVIARQLANIAKKLKTLMLDKNAAKSILPALKTAYSKAKAMMAKLQQQSGSAYAALVEKAKIVQDEMAAVEKAQQAQAKPAIVEVVQQQQADDAATTTMTPLQPEQKEMPAADVVSSIVAEIVESVQMQVEDASIKQATQQQLEASSCDTLDVSISSSIAAAILADEDEGLDMPFTSSQSSILSAASMGSHEGSFQSAHEDTNARDGVESWADQDNPGLDFSGAGSYLSELSKEDGWEIVDGETPAGFVKSSTL